VRLLPSFAVSAPAAVRIVNDTAILDASFGITPLGFGVTNFPTFARTLYSARLVDAGPYAALPAWSAAMSHARLQ
jgi:hypothetical protein